MKTKPIEGNKKKTKKWDFREKISLSSFLVYICMYLCMVASKYQVLQKATKNNFLIAKRLFEIIIAKNGFPQFGKRKQSYTAQEPLLFFFSFSSLSPF